MSPGPNERDRAVLGQPRTTQRAGHVAAMGLVDGLSVGGRGWLRLRLAGKDHRAVLSTVEAQDSSVSRALRYPRRPSAPPFMCGPRGGPSAAAPYRARRAGATAGELFIGR